MLTLLLVILCISVFFYSGVGGWVEGGCLLTIPTDRVGAYSRFGGESNKYGKMVSVVPCKNLVPWVLSLV